MEIKGRHALVTGGAVRVGKAIAIMLAQEGADVSFTFLSSKAEADRASVEIEQLGVHANAVHCDVSQWNDVQRLREVVEGGLGAVDIIVNSAGLFRRTPFPSDDVGLWHAVTRASIDGTFHVCNAFVPGMLKKGSGAIVNILDLSAWHPWHGFVAHGVAKAGMLALTRQLAVELSPSIRTNAVAAGPVLPPIGLSIERQQKIATTTLLNRWGEPADVTSAVRYLVESDYIVGEVLTVDGGERWGSSGNGGGVQ
ncbi:MAG: SDR family NAD(P)-dependent oxidoreductase [Caldilineaceae bacterium]